MGFLLLSFLCFSPLLVILLRDISLKMSEDSQSQNIKRLQGHLTLNANESEISGAILKLLKQKEKTEKWLDFFFSFEIPDSQFVNRYRVKSRIDSCVRQAVFSSPAVLWCCNLTPVSWVRELTTPHHQFVHLRLKCLWPNLWAAFLFSFVFCNAF